MKILVLSLVLSAVAGLEPSKIVQQVPAIYVFGDSTLDVGNNNYLPAKDVPRANKPYYGVDFPGSVPTRKFSNSYNIADFIAKTLGFERSPMAYLALKAHNYLIQRALTRGVSYASAGAGILDSTNAGNNIPLSKQVRFFESTKAEMEAKVGKHVVSDLLSKSFLIGVGSNDFFAFSTAQQKENKSGTQSDVAAFYGSLISNYWATITELYNLGARKLGIINVGPLGFASTDSACCGSGMLGALGDRVPTATLCPNRDRYIFWDSVHTTQQAAKLGAQAFYDGPPQFTTPINFKQLAQKS